MAAVSPPLANPGARRLAWAAALLGLVLGATLLAFWVATRNFAIADPLRSPRTAEVLAMANVEGDESRVMFSRYFASESNRAMFGLLAPLQIAACAGALLLAGRALGSRRSARVARWLLGACLGFSIALAPLVPWMIEHGRAIDFVPRSQPSADREAFYLWHGLYMAGDALRFLAALVALPLIAAAARPLRAAEPSAHAGDRP